MQDIVKRHNFSINVDGYGTSTSDGVTLISSEAHEFVPPRTVVRYERPVIRVHVVRCTGISDGIFFRIIEELVEGVSAGEGTVL